MLQYIDSAIGFVLIMLTVSLVIMVIMQAVSSLLDLRGRNLVWAMEQLFKQVSPETKKKLGDPAAPFFSKLTSFLKAKWANLLRTRFARTTVAEEIANAIANHPAVAPNANSLATAIRPVEIRDVLQAIKDGRGRQAFADLDAEVQRQITVLLQPAEGVQTNLSTANAALLEIEGLLPTQAAEVKKVLQAAVEATSKEAIDRVMDEVRAQAADKAEAIKRQIEKVTVLEQGIEKWFNTVMDHASTRFTKHNRLWTLIIAIGLTLFFRIDSIDVFKQIFSNPELRAKLVNAADGARKQTDEILQRQHVGTQAMEDLIAQGKVSDSAKTALAKLPPNRDTCADGEEYLKGISGITTQDVDAYRTICDGKQKAIIGGASSDIRQLTNRLDSQELNVFNQVEWPHLFGPQGRAWSDVWAEFRAHLRGLILTVLLLSLGAPFWFDALKSIVSLRPTIAGKVDKEVATTTPPRV